MNKSMIGIIAIVFLMIVVPGGMYISTGNNLVTLEEGINSSWAQIETVLQRRYDLIPNLVETVKGYAEHEKSLLEEVTRLRSQWAGAGSSAEKIQAANAMESAIGRLMVVVENYPGLKANQNFLALQDELAGSENRIAVERRRYNEAVRTYNVAVRRFPGTWVAGCRGMETRSAYFEAAAPAQVAPKVQF